MMCEELLEEPQTTCSMLNDRNFLLTKFVTDDDFLKKISLTKKFEKFNQH